MTDVAQHRAIFASSEKVNAIRPQMKFMADCQLLDKGTSFSVGTVEIKEANLRAKISKINKKLSPKRFKVVNHLEHKLYEVARIA